MSLTNLLGGFLERTEKKHPLLFLSFYPAAAAEIGFLSVILLMFLIKWIVPKSEVLIFNVINNVSGAGLICCVGLLPLLITILNLRHNLKTKRYVFYKNTGCIIMAAFIFSALIFVNDLIMVGSFNFKYFLTMLVLNLIVVIFLSCIAQVILVFSRARNE